MTPKKNNVLEAWSNKVKQFIGTTENSTNIVETRRF
jgi:hypothetical protein